MIFNSDGKYDDAILTSWHYYGKCKDKNNKIWTFYTNSATQFRNLKKRRKWEEFKIIEIRTNKNYNIIKKLTN